MVKILIVESYFNEWRDVWIPKLNGQVFVLSARTIQEANQVYIANPDLSAIATAGCVGMDVFNVESLITEFKAKFKGPIIGCSTSMFNRQDLLRVGCTHVCDKLLLAEKINEVLGLEPGGIL